MESANVPNSRKMDNENVVCIHNGVLFSPKEEQNHIICRKIDETGDQMELDIIIFSKISQTQKDNVVEIVEFQKIKYESRRRIIRNY
jgi:hypothetical protein